MFSHPAVRLQVCYAWGLRMHRLIGVIPLVGSFTHVVSPALDQGAWCAPLRPSD
jgi:hypothetical protein